VPPYAVDGLGILELCRAKRRWRNVIAEAHPRPGEPGTEPAGSPGGAPLRELGTFVLLVERSTAWQARTVSELNVRRDAASGVSETPRQRLYYRLFLPLGVLANLALGLVILMRLIKSDGSVGWLEVGTGALCCAIAGWLAAAAWSKSYWHRSMARQVAVWRRIADALFTWIEDAPLPAETVYRLKASLDEAVPTPQQR
jgi:hypothetical protein